MNAAVIRLIRIDGIVPHNKTAIREALEVAPENIMLIRPADEHVTNPDADRIAYLDSLQAGESIAFTDGAGKYYGKIVRTFVDEKTVNGPKPSYLLDAKV